MAICLPAAILLAMPKPIVLVVIMLLCALPLPARAEDDNNYVSFSFENDSIGKGGDRYYTSGARLSWYNVNTTVPELIDDIAESIPMFDINEHTGTMFSLGQNLFTPDGIDNGDPREDDRPWAAWTYASVGLVTPTGNRIDELELTLGVVGPEALGEQTQKFIHSHVTGSPTPKGWRHQLAFEPGIIISWQRRWPEKMNWHMGDLSLRVIPNINASVGNVYTYAGTGLTVTLGPNHHVQDTPPRVRPSVPGTGYFTSPPPGWSWQLFASADGRAVARNIFLDGNTFRDSPSVDKKPLVGDLSGGLALTFADFRLAYSLNMRSAEFDGQGAESVFGALTLTTRF